MRIAQRKLGWKEVGDDDDWEVYWTDLSITIDRVMKLTKTQVGPPYASNVDSAMHGSKSGLVHMLAWELHHASWCCSEGALASCQPACLAYAQPTIHMPPHQATGLAASLGPLHRVESKLRWLRTACIRSLANGLGQHIWKRQDNALLLLMQKINHFNGMLELCRKRPMAKNLMRMQKLYPALYDFFPRTFNLPGDREVRGRESKTDAHHCFRLMQPVAFH